MVVAQCPLIQTLLGGPVASFEWRLRPFRNQILTALLEEGDYDSQKSGHRPINVRETLPTTGRIIGSYLYHYLELLPSSLVLREWFLNPASPESMQLMIFRELVDATTERQVHARS